MISVKSGTKTWSETPQQSSLKSDGKQILSSAEQQEVLGNQDLGSYLNKIADPNWVDPVKTRQVGNNNMDKEAFLKLFLAQLKNQDPMNPMESHELAAQLAQFTSLEKLSNIDEGISNMSKQNDPAKSFDSLQLIGRGVAGDTSKIFRGDENATHEVGFQLGAPATEVELSILNNQNQEVKKLIARNLKSGQNVVSWDGMLDAGSKAPEGEYRIAITAKDGAGQKIGAQTKFEGKVTGVNFTPEGPILMVGKQSIKMKDVQKIFDPSQLSIATNTVDAQAVAGKDAKSLGGNTVGMGGNLESVGMSQGLINRLEKEASQKGEKQQ
jgi:flagellar basal-body rod modification protein FlgD